MPVFKFKPNKRKPKYAPSNQERADSAYASISHCSKYASPKIDDDSIRDLLADLLHLSDSKSFDTRQILNDAVNNWEVER